MVRYVVIAEVPIPRAAEWYTWMCQQHIPAVLATGCFQRALLWREALAGEVAVFLVEYDCLDESAFQRYQEQYAPALRQDHAQRFGAEVRLQRLLLTLQCTVEPPTTLATS